MRPAFQTDPHDPATLVVVVALLGSAACLAAWLPARRAASIDPVVALRTEESAFGETS